MLSYDNPKLSKVLSFPSKSYVIYSTISIILTCTTEYKLYIFNVQIRLKMLQRVWPSIISYFVGTTIILIIHSSIFLLSMNFHKLSENDSFFVKNSIFAPFLLLNPRQSFTSSYSSNSTFLSKSFSFIELKGRQSFWSKLMRNYHRQV